MANFTIACDLGQVRDYSALVVAERLQRMVGRPSLDNFDDDAGYHVEDVYHIVHIQRFELGTPYPAVVDSVSDLFNSGRLPRNETHLVFDRTGVGGAVADMFTEAFQRDRLGPHWPQGISLTAGFGRSGGGAGTYSTTAHKGDIVQRLYRLLEEGRLKLPLGLPGADQLVSELRAFRLKQNERTGNLSFEAEHESDHDDVVVALALAVWFPHIWGEPKRLQ